MGYASRYCVVCGRPLVHLDCDDMKKDLLEQYTYDMEDDSKIVDDEIVNNKVDKIFTDFPFSHAKYAWLNDLFLITDQGEIINATSDDYDNWSHGQFNIENRIIEISSLTFIDERDKHARAIVCHKECYTFLKQNFDYKLCYYTIKKYVNNCDNVIKKKNFYLEMDRYMDQHEFAYQTYSDDNWMLDITNKRNKHRLSAMWYSIIYM